MITTDISKAKQVLEAGGIVAIPTETVYGLAGNAFNEAAVRKIFELKRRPLYNPLIVHIHSAEFLSQVATDIPAAAIKLAESLWPGPLTMILKKKPAVPDLVTAGKDTVAVRVPNHPLALQLLRQLSFPLAAPSANPFSSISPTTAAHVAEYFGDQLPVILDGGDCQRGLESTIIGFEEEQPVLYRLGALPVEGIEKVAGKVVYRTKAAGTDVTAPGMLSKHYSPATRTLLTENVDQAVRAHRGLRIGLLVFKDSYRGDDVAYQECLSPSGDMETAAANLYAAMHRLDKQDLDLILAELLPEEGLGKTINDRLRRAAEQ